MSTAVSKRAAKAAAKDELRKLAFDLFSTRSIEETVEEIKTEHAELVAAAGYKVINNSRIYRLSDEYFDSITNRQTAAQVIFHSGIKHAAENINRLHQRVRNSQGADTDASREQRGWYDLAAKLSGAYAPEKVQNIDEAQAEIIDMDEIYIARQKALDQEGQIIEIESRAISEDEDDGGDSNDDE